MGGLKIYHSRVQVTGLPGPKKIKKAKFGHKQFQKGQILKK